MDDDLRDEMAPMVFNEPAVNDLPVRVDGTLDASRLNISDRDQRNAFVAQLGDLCRAYGPADTVAVLVPAMLEAVQYDDAALPIANVLAEVGNSLRPTVRPLIELQGLLRELFEHVDGHIGAAAAKAAVDFVSAAENSDEERALFVSIVSKLAGGGQGISAKCAAAAMLPAAHSVALLLQNSAGHNAATVQSSPFSPPVKAIASPNDAVADVDPKRRVNKTKTLFSDLIRDSSSAVRRAAAASLAEWLNRVGAPGSAPDTLMQIKAWVTDLSRDRLQDSVRFAALPHIVAIARLSPSAADINGLVQLALSAAKDPSWRVRWTAARHVVSLMLVQPSAAMSLLPSLQALAKDEEAEVRSCVAQRLGEAASVLAPHVVSAELVPLATAFSSDVSGHVKAAAAASVCEVCRACGDDDVGALVDIIAKFIDDASDAVQLNVLRSLPMLKERLDSERVLTRISDLLARISQVTVSRWRVRERVAEQLRHLAVHVTAQQSTAARAKLEGMLDGLVDDPVAAVRTTAVASLPMVAAQFGPVWTRAAVERFGDRLHTGYRERQTYVSVLDAMLPFAVATLRPRTMSAIRDTTQSSGALATPQKSLASCESGGTDGSRSPLGDRASFAAAPVGFAGGSPSPLSPQQATVELQSSEVAFWNRVRADVIAMARDAVPNVRLAVCRWMYSTSVTRTPMLVDLRPQLQSAFEADPCDDVKSLAADASTKRLASADPY